MRRFRAYPFFERVRVDPRTWHIPFRSAPDAPEFLTAGRERAYISQFFNRNYDPSAFTSADIEQYKRGYATPGGMRCAFETYRAFPIDARDNASALIDKLSLPALAVAPSSSILGPLIKGMMEEVATDVSELFIPNASHWIAEEQPEAFASGLSAFLARE